MVTGEFESETFIAEMIIWIMGEAEFVAARKANGWNVNKHYDLTSPQDLEVALLEIVALVADGSVPDEAATAWDVGDG